MTTVDFITQLFCRIDDLMPNAEKHSQANLSPSEVVTLAILFALKGVGNRSFYRWLERDYKPLFPKLPVRTRLFRLFNTHRQWTQTFMAEPSLIGIVDSYGIELIHPRREGRSDQQIGKKGLSNQRWIVGGKLGYVINHLGLVVDWDVDTANVHVRWSGLFRWRRRWLGTMRRPACARRPHASCMTPAPGHATVGVSPGAGPVRPRLKPAG